MKWSQLNFEKLNYILIPKTKEAREKFIQSRTGAFFLFFFDLYFMFSRDGRVLLFCWTLATALSINIGFTQYYVVWSVLSGVLLASVLLRRSVMLHGVRVSFLGPARVTKNDEIHLTVEFQNDSEQVHQAIEVERPFLPWDGRYLNDRLFVRHLEPGQHVSCTIVAAFKARGEHHLDPITARALAPLGMALSPAIVSGGLAFLVIPRIARVVHIDIDTVQKYQPGGVALASITGESRELVGVRPYRIGDPIRDLHAKTWARIGQPVVREYQQEYFTRIGIIVDTDDGRPDEAGFEGMLSLAAGVVAHLSRGEALLDLLVLGQDIHQLTLGRSLGFLEQALDLLACVEPQQGFAVSALSSQLKDHLSRLSCMIVLSMKWDDKRQELAAWIEQHGVRCVRLGVSIAQEEPGWKQAGVIHVLASDIHDHKELVL